MSECLVQARGVVGGCAERQGATAAEKQRQEEKHEYQNVSSLTPRVVAGEAKTLSVRAGIG